MGNFEFIPTSLPGVVIVETKQYGDARGAFMETYQETAFKQSGIETRFVQDNQSSSTQGVLRGLHFQKHHPQAKLVRVVEGEVFDVAVDLRPNSSSFGKWEGVLLSSTNHRQFFIPRGFAHGFLVLSETAIFTYKCDDFYHPEDEGGLLWNDPDIAIAWPLIDAQGNRLLPILSEKDACNPHLSDLLATPDTRGNL